MLHTHNSQTEPSSDKVETPTALAIHRKWPLLLDIAILFIMSLLLFWGTSTQFSNPYSDMTRYQCYAIAFWQGQAGLQAHALQATPTSQCAFLLTDSSSSLIAKLSQYHLPSFFIHLLHSQPTTQPFHALPPEYPFLTLIPFSIPLLVPFGWYQVTFSLLMTLVAIALYAVLMSVVSRPAALAFVFYLVVGSWATATDRFDLIPAALTLGAVILAGKARWKWAFALLALATLYKFYPIILVIPFLIAQQIQYRDKKWTSWKRWSALSIFVGLGLLITLISFFLNIANTLYPLAYFFNRPIQVESFPGTLIWISSLLGHPTQYNMAYQSLNFVSSLERFISPFSTLLEIAGLLYTFWLQWRSKIDVYTASLLTILIIMITGKVFSPQYLIWATPLIALVGKANWKWLLSWGLVCALTTFMYPLHYNSLQQIQQFYPVIFARDLLILGITCALLYWYSRRKPEAATSEVVEQQKPI
jgi:hypothetical protein